jgi:hypothetical protein
LNWPGRTGSKESARWKSPEVGGRGVAAGAEVGRNIGFMGASDGVAGGVGIDRGGKLQEVRSRRKNNNKSVLKRNIPPF